MRSARRCADTANNPSVISISWGQSEDSWTESFLQSMDGVLEAATQARHYGLLRLEETSGSGDNVQDGLAHVDFPASSPRAPLDVEAHR